MRVLYISAWDGEDYGAQYLYDGFCDLLGWENVVDWPSNRYLHRPYAQPRQYDADLSWPERRLHEWEIHDLLRSGWFDLVVISSARPIALGMTQQLQHWLVCARNGIVLLDMEDSESVTVGPLLEIEAIRSHIRGIFKRELRSNYEEFGGLSVLPCPFSYPQSRIVSVDAKPVDGPLVFYHAHDWGWAPGSPRHQMVEMLRSDFGAEADVGLSSEKMRDGRLSNIEYYQRLRRARIGVALNRDGGSDNNRYWETVAAGCVLLSDRPRHCIPHNFENGIEAFFYDDAHQAVEIVRRLRSEPNLAKQVARAGQRKLLACHTTRARAQYVLECLGLWAKNETVTA